MSINEESFDRLKQAVKFLKKQGRIHKQQDIADTLNMPKSSISEAMAGKPRCFTDGFLRRFAAAYGHYINKEWLLTATVVWRCLARRSWISQRKQ